MNFYELNWKGLYVLIQIHIVYISNFTTHMYIRMYMVYLAYLFHFFVNPSLACCGSFLLSFWFCIRSHRLLIYNAHYHWPLTPSSCSLCRYLTTIQLFLHHLIRFLVSAKSHMIERRIKNLLKHAERVACATRYALS